MPIPYNGWARIKGVDGKVWHRIINAESVCKAWAFAGHLVNAPTTEDPVCKRCKKLLANEIGSC
jgi:hypothetical protein